MPMKELHKSDGGDIDVSGASCVPQVSSLPLHEHSRSDFGSLGESIISSLHYSQLFNYGESVEGSSGDLTSLADTGHRWSHISTSYTAAHGTPTRKHATEIIKEIAALELEVLRLERYLLSLYRTAFDRYATTMSKDKSCEFPPIYQCDSSAMTSRNQWKIRTKQMSFHEQSTSIGSVSDRRNKSYSVDDIKKIHGFDRASRHEFVNSCDRSVPSTKSSTDSARSTPHHRRLANHLCTSTIIDCVSETPCKLSEEIVRCVSSIYKRLTDPPVSQTDLLASPLSSFSSSSTLSPRDTNGTWSPKYANEPASSLCHFDVTKDKQTPYRGMLEVLKFCIDGDKFKYAATALQHFKDLICRLETIDPRKMEHEEKLSFWINIHNALVMHAFLAYGLHQNCIKSSSSTMKAAYNVGGLSVNAYEIQKFILECHPHRPELRLQTLFSQPQKLVKSNHAYALDKREPLVHFALCMGASSDPAVRLYTSKNVLKELEIAKDEYLQSNVSVHKEAKISLPKILQYYAKDSSMGLSSVLEMVHSCMPEIPQKTMQKFIQGRTEKYVDWLPYKSNFKYTIHRDLARDYRLHFL